MKGTKDANLPTEDCIPPDYAVLDGDDGHPGLQALIPDYSEPKVLKITKIYVYGTSMNFHCVTGLDSLIDQS